MRYPSGSRTKQSSEPPSRTEYGGSLRLDPLLGKRGERLVHRVDRERDVPVCGAELVGVDAEVVGQLELRLLLPGHAEEVVHRLVADRQLTPLLEAERLVEGDRPLRVGDAVAGVDQLHAREPNGRGAGSRTPSVRTQPVASES